MKRILYVFAVVGLLGMVVFVQNRAEAQTTPTKAAGVPEAHRKLINTYCLGCHNSRAKIGGLAMDALNMQTPTVNAETWEQALKKLRGRLMPPPGSPQPPQADIDAFSTWMEAKLDAPSRGIHAGYVPVQRLNRTEYVSSVKNLVGVEMNEKDVLPQDIQIGGFDNIASALTTSPAFLDQYVNAARRIAKLAVGDMRPPISSYMYRVDGNQDPAIPMPPGLRGGMKIQHSFPADGEYRFSLFDLSIGLYNRTLQNSSTLVLLLDGKTVFKGDIGGLADLRLANVKGTDGWQEILNRFQKIPVKVLAGKHDIVVGFIDRAHVESDDNVGGGGGGRGGAGGAPVPILSSNNTDIDVLEVKGPYNPTGITNSTTRPLIFVCDPQAIGETPCARRIAEDLAHRAFRRPITQDDVATLMKFYNDGRLDGAPFDKGVEQIVAAVLASPDFLYRSIRGGKGVPKVTEFSLTSLELATRLSFFLWNTPPDAELLKLAEANGLTKPGALDAQVKRMLADPKAQSIVNGFAMKWLNLNSLDSVQPNAQIFNGFSPALRRDFMTEAEKFLSSILLDNRSVVDLLTSNQTFLNNRLARHYGIANGPTTSQFRAVTLTDPVRFGLLGKAAVLMRTSYGDRTSPVLRGAWVLDKLIGTPPTPPPPNVETDLSQPPGEAPKTVRARLEQHRAAPTCRQCHGVIDPTGLALENFDSIGQFRTNDRQANNTPIDASTVTSGGVALNGPVELAKHLASRPEAFVSAMTERLLMYAINRDIAYYDMPQIRKIVRSAKPANYTLASLVLGIVNSDAFRKQGVAAKAAPKAVAKVAANVTGSSVASEIKASAQRSAAK
jgi:mono/diheme cytochrome c family protein